MRRQRGGSFVFSVSNLYRIPEQEELAQWLVDHSCADSVFFCNSGAEANGLHQTGEKARSPPARH